MFSSSNLKHFAVNHIHHPVTISTLIAVVPSSDHYCIETVAQSGDHSSIETVAPSSDHYCIATVAPSGDHCFTETVAPSSDHHFIDHHSDRPVMAVILMKLLLGH